MLLRKAIYGLKQAGRQWALALSNVLQRMGFVRCASEPCIFLRGNVWVGAYVDDLVVAVHEADVFNVFIRELEESFSLSSSGPLHHLLGLGFVFDYNNKTVDIKQEAAIVNMAKKFNIDIGRATWAKTPWPTAGLPKDGGALLEDRTSYRSLVGGLLYFAGASRPDIAFSVSQLATGMEAPTVEHLKLAVRVMRYLLRTSSTALRLGGGDCILRGFCDASWNNAPKSRSVTGYLLFLGGGPVVWRSTVQDSVAHSSTEAEVNAANEIAKENQWLLALLKELNISLKVATKVGVDCQPALHIIVEGRSSRRSKHFLLRAQSVLDCVRAHAISFFKVPSALNVADVLTKGLEEKKHFALCARVFASGVVMAGGLGGGVGE